MATFTTTTKALVVTAAVALLAACGVGSDGDKAKTGILKLGITDAPVDSVAEVHVQFTGLLFVVALIMGGVFYFRPFATQAEQKEPNLLQDLYSKITNETKKSTKEIALQINETYTLKMDGEIKKIDNQPVFAKLQNNSLTFSPQKNNSGS